LRGQRRQRSSRSFAQGRRHVEEPENCLLQYFDSFLDSSVGRAPDC
jgi:hypothetical protein